MALNKRPKTACLIPQIVYAYKHLNATELTHPPLLDGFFLNAMNVCLDV